MNKNFRQFATGYNLVLKFGIMVSLPICCSLSAGTWLDKKLGTAPWIMFILMIAGLAFSVYATYRVSIREAKQYQALPGKHPPARYDEDDDNGW